MSGEPLKGRPSNNPKGRTRKATKKDEKEIYEMYKAGKPIAVIAFTFEISASTVQRIIRRIKESEEQKNG